MPRKPNVRDSRQYWVWVTTVEYYAEDDGSDRKDLDPSTQSDPGGWWTCHRDTRLGDLALLYRAKPKMHLGYLIQAESDAYSIADDRHAIKRGWDYGCDYRVLYKFENPITLNDMRQDPYLDEWGALRANFQRRVYAVPRGIWQRLLNRMEETEPRFVRFLRRGGVEKASAKIEDEEELENRLAKDTILRPFGFDLEVRERQRFCEGHGGRIDLLCYERKRKRYVVVELRNVRAGQNTFGQIATYLGWVQQRLSNGKPAHGLVIARGFDNRFLAAAAASDHVSYLDLQELSFE